jgi:hypothetical protein
MLKLHGVRVFVYVRALINFQTFYNSNGHSNVMVIGFDHLYGTFICFQRFSTIGCFKINLLGFVCV